MESAATTGVNVTITIFGDFGQSSAKKLAIILKTNVIRLFRRKYFQNQKIERLVKCLCLGGVV
jgi:hypothetical protein